MNDPRTPERRAGGPDAGHRPRRVVAVDQCPNPVEYGSWGRACEPFRRWQQDGTWQRILTQLQS
ncbi:Putative transposase of IS4/5 family [Streptomyces sp. AmelKG-D3]|nr:Putative transposase of IS4/5 family [Streptomyces sp. AmelKG-D3]